MKKIFSALLLVSLILLMLSGCGLYVPSPEIKSGEFNFSVTYEYGGETNTVSGVYVCEYNGTEWFLDSESVRDWKGYIKGGQMDDHVSIDIINENDEIILVLNLEPEYFMDDYDFDLYGVPEPYIMIKDHTEEGGLSIIHDAADVEEICGARIISYEYDAPIENTFGLFK